MRASSKHLLIALALLTALGSVPSCGEGSGPSATSESHFLDYCDGDRDCLAGDSCICNVCTQACVASDDCAGTETTTECVVMTSGPRGACGSGSSTEVLACLPPCGAAEPCDRGQMCLDGSCIPTPPRDRGDGGLDVGFDVPADGGFDIPEEAGVDAMTDARQADLPDVAEDALVDTPDIAGFDGPCAVTIDEIVAETNLCDPPSIGVDGSGTAHIGWVSFTPYLGHYARRDGTDDWSVENPAGEDFVRDLGLAVDSSGSVAVLVHDGNLETSLYSGPPFELQQTLSGGRFGTALAYDSSDVLHGLVASARMPAAAWIRGLHALEGDANAVSQSLVVEVEGDLRGHLAMIDDQPSVLYRYSQGLFFVGPSGEHEPLSPADDGLEFPIDVLVPGDADAGPSPLRILRTGYRRDTETDDTILATRVSEDEWVTEPVLVSMRGPNSLDCPDEDPGEGDSCPVDEFSYDRLAASARNAEVWIFSIRTHWLGQFRFSCVDFIGDFECGWVPEHTTAYDLRVTKVVDGEVAEPEATVVQLAGHANLDLQVGPGDATHVALTQRLPNGELVDTCSVRYLALSCE